MPDSILISQSIIEPLPAFVAAVGGAKASADLNQRVGRVTKPHGEPEVSANRIMQLFEQLARDLNNPGFGLDYARAFPVGAGSVRFVSRASEDMRWAVRPIRRYTQIVMPSVDVRYEQLEDGAQLTWSYPLLIGSPIVQFNSFAAALVVLRLRSWLSGTWCPKLVQLAHRDPGAGDSYRRMFGANVCFEQPVNRFTFLEANLDPAKFLR